MLTKSLFPTDDELATGWIKKYPGTIYCRSQFYRCIDGIFQSLEEIVVNKEILTIIVAAKKRGAKPTSNRVNSIRKLAESLIYKDPNTLDGNPDLFAFTNGVFNLRTLEFSPHALKNYVSIHQDYPYDPKATCPFFMKVIIRFDEETQTYIQEFMGYSATAETKLETMLWLYGGPGSGKSTLIKGFEAFLGKYCVLLPPSCFNGNRFGLSNALGARLYTATEVPKKGVDDTSILKALVSGEAITIERKHVDSFTYIPFGKVIWAMNEVPNMDFLRDGIGRRVQIIKFPDLPETERDPNFGQQIMQEGPGIFNWALEGLLSLRKRGNFIIPESVKAAKRQIQGKSVRTQTPEDVLRWFIQERCKVGHEYKSQAAPTGEAIREFCRKQGIRELNSSQISTGLQNMKYRKSCLHGTNHYHGFIVIGNDD